jgi:transcription elongation factor GreA
MRVPTRRYDVVRQAPDPHITPAKYDELQAKLHKLKNTTRFKWMTEVARMAEMGDFSENHGYQVAKGKLRGVNAKILELEDQLRKAVIIEASVDGRVAIGSTVVVQVDGQAKTYQILGSVETDPLAGIISHTSPLGALLLGRRAGEAWIATVNGRERHYQIISVA